MPTIVINDGMSALNYDGSVYVSNITPIRAAGPGWLQVILPEPFSFPAYNVTRVDSASLSWNINPSLMAPNEIDLTISGANNHNTLLAEANAALFTARAQNTLRNYTASGLVSETIDVTEIVRAMLLGTNTRLTFRLDMTGTLMSGLFIYPGLLSITYSGSLGDADIEDRARNAAWWILQP